MTFYEDDNDDIILFLVTTLHGGMRSISWLTPQTPVTCHRMLGSGSSMEGGSISAIGLDLGQKPWSSGPDTGPLYLSRLKPPLYPLVLIICKLPWSVPVCSGYGNSR